MMQTSNDVRRYANRNEYLAQKKSGISAVTKNGNPPSPSVSDAKVDLTDKAKTLSEERPTSLATTSDLGVVKDVVEVAGKTAAKLAETELATAMIVPKSRPNRVEHITKMDASNPLIKKPGIFFVSGFDLFNVASEAGMKEMALSIEGGQHFKWSQVVDMLDEIKKRPPDKPIIIVGHGYGGGSALKVAEKLNTPAYGFRTVDLLVTVDALGSPSHITPQNVKEHLNFIGEKDGFFNGSPHMARNEIFTDVTNELSVEPHSVMDQSRDIQFQIFDKIKQVLTPT